MAARLPIAVEFELTDAERRAALADKEKRGSVMSWRSFALQMALPIWWIVTYGRGYANPGVPAAGRYAMVIGAIFCIAMLALKFARVRRSISRGGRLSVTFAERGIDLVSRGRRRAVAWSEISRTHFGAAAISFTTAGLAGYEFVTIPHRALPDDGTELWAYLEERFVARRNLVVPSGPRHTLVNTAAR